MMKKEQVKALQQQGLTRDQARQRVYGGGRRNHSTRRSDLAQKAHHNKIRMTTTEEDNEDG